MDFTIFKQKFTELLANSTYGGYVRWIENGEYWEDPQNSDNTSGKGLRTIQSYVKGCCDVIRNHMPYYVGAPVGHYTNRDILYCIMNDSSDYAVLKNDKSFWRLLKEIYVYNGSVVDDNEYLSIFTITFDEANKNDWSIGYGVESLPYIKQEIHKYETIEYSGTTYVDSTPVWSYNVEFNGPEWNPVGPGQEYSGEPTDQTSPLLLFIYTKKNFATMNTFQQYSGCEISDEGPTTMSRAFENTDIVKAPYMDLSNVNDCSLMFSTCRQLTDADYVSLPIAGEINIEGMFDNCTALVTAPIWLSYINPTNLNQTFFACSSLETVPDIECGYTTANQYGSFEMFGACEKLTNVWSLSNLGKSWIAIDSMYSETNTTTFNLRQSPLLTQQSVLNIAKSVYDMNLNTKTNAEIIFHKDVYDNIPAEVLAIFTAKKWTVVSA